MGWVFLILASVLEVGFTTALRLSDEFRNIPAVAALCVCVPLSILFLEWSGRSVPLGTAYSIWTGIGAVGTVVIGIVWFGEPGTVVRVVLILGIIACVIGLKFTGG